MKALLAIILSGICLGVNAQDISSVNLTWTVDHLTDLVTGTQQEYVCTFQTGSDTITWSQHGGDIIYLLNVQSASGSWTDVSAQGQVTYTVSGEGASGTITFQRDETGVFITLDFSAADANNPKQKYRVTGIN